jgi:hypothetical protein
VRVHTPPHPGTRTLPAGRVPDCTSFTTAGVGSPRSHGVTPCSQHLLHPAVHNIYQCTLSHAPCARMPSCQMRVSATCGLGPVDELPQPDDRRIRAVERPSSADPPGVHVSHRRRRHCTHLRALRA